MGRKGGPDRGAAPRAALQAFPPPGGRWRGVCCGDNAAMIGCQGYYEFLAGRTAGLDLNAYATRDISLG